MAFNIQNEAKCHVWVRKRLIDKDKSVQREFYEGMDMIKWAQLVARIYARPQDNAKLWH